MYNLSLVLATYYALLMPTLYALYDKLNYPVSLETCTAEETCHYAGDYPWITPLWACIALLGPERAILAQASSPTSTDKSRFALFSVCALVTVALAAEAAKQAVNYSEGYRQWHLVLSLVIQKGHKDFEMFGGIHHIYANKKAFEARTKGKPYPDGAVFVNDVLEAAEKDNVMTKGPCRFIGVMQKKPKKAADTGYVFSKYRK